MSAGLKVLVGESGGEVYINPTSVAAITPGTGAVCVWLHGSQYPIRVRGDIDQVAMFLSGSH